MLSENIVLSSGISVPVLGDSRQRREGVALVLSIAAWRVGGSSWRAWNSRLVTATLPVVHRKCCAKLRVLLAMCLLMLPVGGIKIVFLLFFKQLFHLCLKEIIS